MWNVELPREELADTPESPKPEQVEKTKDLFMLHFTRKDSVYGLEGKSGSHIHGEHQMRDIPDRKDVWKM